ncbi:response regulator [Chamaesiphon minutus]|uniref:Response regulator with CheY-like receiver domain and winged-helix DNA-binding domain n=1 Tax=Chamaesiphon minutus (strain ATCC 27169 / PCC 6605) TaxID=1173020 RepID=K9UJL2_CHAP6|nr:response regulator [Chamaesiphon minutus]AFY94651.1 response regulator with CheY-like receiver domain and winged-helix DNA-binding domain [Chamaesiphon minutus PCC 6605]
MATKISTALIVEDVRTDLMILTSYLESLGWRVITAMNGEEALTYLSNNKPDIVFLDVVLPGRSGFEICRTIKSQTETEKIPVVMCSTKNTDMDRFWGLKQGADLYLTKPVNRHDFMDVIQKLGN